MKLLSSGAEATIYLDNNEIVKDRPPKPYRIKEIDEPMRKSRTNREAKILNKLNLLIKKENFTIRMKYIEGDKLADKLEVLPLKEIGTQIGKKLKALHKERIIHGDLTTSNIIANKEGVHFIDFGLSFYSDKVEDKAVDLHLLRQALESKHHTIFEEVFKEICKAYNDKEVLKRLEIVESRGRNKKK